MNTRGPALGERGFSLVELMIAMLLGLVLMAGVLSLFSATLHSNNELLKAHQLQDQLAATMALISRDLTRAGYDAHASNALDRANPFAALTTGAATDEPADSCILFSYDRSNSGVLKDQDKIGYRLHDATVQMRDSSGSCTDASGWTDVTTTQLVKVTGLHFAVTTASAGKLQLRHVVISIAGQLKSKPGVTRKLQRIVHIRNAVPVS